MARGRIENLVLVNERDEAIGLAEKLRCHLDKGILHRAFSVYVFNKWNQLLLQKRSDLKLLWPLFWSNTCCSHPQEKEEIVAAGQRRLKEEMGFSCPLKIVGKFQYQAVFGKIGSENEVLTIAVGQYDGEIKADPKEVSAFRWVGLKDLKKEIEQNTADFTPWFKMALNKIFFNGKIKNLS